MSSSVVSVAPDQPNVLHALTRKHADINGQIGRARQVLRQLTAELEHINAAIRIFDPTIDIGAIRAKTTPVRKAAHHGEVARIVIDTLRETDQPLTPRAITERLMTVRCLNGADRELFDIMLKRIRACLRSQRARGLVQPIALTDRLQGWEIKE